MENLLEYIDRLALSQSPYLYVGIILILGFIVGVFLIAYSMLQEKLAKAEYMVKILKSINEKSEAGSKRLVEQIDLLRTKNAKFEASKKIRDPKTGRFVKRFGLE